LAAAGGNRAADPRHLLQALLREEEGRPWLLLVNAGADPVRLRQRFPKGTEPPAETDPAARPPLNTAIQQVLAEARALARERSADGTVASEWVLFALLRREEGLRQELERLGLALPRLEGQMQAAQAPPLRLDEPLELEDWTERLDSARLLDAAANRAREALRVLEDYARFVRDDAYLSGELKRLRHGLAEALGVLPPQLLLEARDTLGDVGTTISTAAEGQRHSLTDVVRANCKRLQEALRSLEELGKLHGPSLGERLEKLRYQSYTLERALLLGGAARQRLAEARLYVLVMGDQCRRGLEATVRGAVEGGAQVIQLREKGLPDGVLLDRARRVGQWTRRHGVVFLVNDRPDIARLAEADGVHLGQEDLSVRDARRILGPGALIGVSTHDLGQLRRAVLAGASYVGVGPTFPSKTKEFAAFPGLDFVRQAMAETSLPAFAIGGITGANLEGVLAAGARRVAVSAAVCQADEPQAVAAALRQVLERC
jgi:thiamine-phosphate pyrophosphorylase